MLKKKNIAPIIIGAVLILWALSLTLLLLADSFSGAADLEAALPAIFVSILCPMFLFIPGFILLLIGIIKLVKVIKHNREVVAKHEIDFAQCPYCQYQFKAARTDFRAHRSFPEGYVSCPSCKKPLSYKLFKIISTNEYNDEYSC